jgi:2',3'-cyclic-nucleotide 2'-phosphodiesterase (5'-nucleotidase family)
VARRATAIKDIRSGESQGTVLLLDAGNALFGQHLALKTEGRIIVEAMNAMRYDAMTVADRDLLYGLERLIELAQEADFAVLSCNLVDPESGEPLFLPYAILQRDGIRYGIMGVTGSDAADIPGEGRDFTVQDPYEAIETYLTDVQAMSEVVILLSYMGLEEDMRLAEAFPEVDIIVGGKSRSLMQSPEVVGSTAIIQAGYNGEWIGRLTVRFDENWRIADPQAELITLDPDVADDQELKDLVDSNYEVYPKPTLPSR